MQTISTQIEAWLNEVSYWSTLDNAPEKTYEKCKEAKAAHSNIKFEARIVESVHNGECKRFCFVIVRAAGTWPLQGVTLIDVYRYDGTKTVSLDANPSLITTIVRGSSIRQQEVAREKRTIQWGLIAAASAFIGTAAYYGPALSGHGPLICGYMCIAFLGGSLLGNVFGADVWRWSRTARITKAASV